MGVNYFSALKVDISDPEVMWQWISNLNMRIPGELVTCPGSSPTYSDQVW